MRRLRWLLAPVAFVGLAVVIACGGDKKGADGANASPPRSGGTVSDRQIDLLSTAAELEELRSFRFDMTMKLKLDASAVSSDEDDLGAAIGAALLGALGDMKAEGAFVAPDQTQMKLRMLGQEFEMVQIGDKAWVKIDGKWQETDASEEMGFSMGDSPTDLLGGLLPSEVLKGAKVSKEKVNGVEATRYSFDKASLLALAEAMGETGTGFDQVSKANLDLWLMDDKIPVKIVLDIEGEDEDGNAVGMELQMNIRDINSDSIKIKAPV
jgi:hypothetical protein